VAYYFLFWFVLLYRQNVVVVGAGRFSRSAKFTTSSELLYLLNLLYNTPSECCDEYKLIQLYQKSSVWCFAFSHTSTFELIPAVATAQPGALVTGLSVCLPKSFLGRNSAENDLIYFNKRPKCSSSDSLSVAKFIYPACIWRTHRGWPRRHFAKMFDTHKTRMIGLLCGEETMTILCWAVS